jgi:hypothetical protein
MTNKTPVPYISKYSTDDEVAEYAKAVAEAADAVMKRVSAEEMGASPTIEFCSALGKLIAMGRTIGERLPERMEWINQQRQEARELAEQRRTERRLARGIDLDGSPRG